MSAGMCGFDSSQPAANLSLARLTRPFVLITGTVITLILVVVGSVTLLSSLGSQPLPSVLTSSVPGMSVKE